MPTAILDSLYFANRVKHRQRHLVYIALISLSAIVYNEYVSYAMQRYLWPDVSLTANRSKLDSLTVMVVADAQITGYHDNPMFLPYCLTSWDSDRYLRRTFKLAFNHAKPDLLIFLGDLMDEGSVALNKMADYNQSTDEEYENYKNRFQNIFAHGLQSGVEVVYVPGDNDVGGEQLDLKTPLKLQTFATSFANRRSSTINMNFVDFFPISYDIGEGSKNVVDHLRQAMKTSNATYRVLLNHMPLLERTYFEFFRLIKESLPSLIISSHSHKSQLYVCDNCEIDQPYDTSDNLMDDHDAIWEGQRMSMKLNQIYRLRIGSKSLVEIVVPTSSYRMGTSTVGYGIFIIDDTGIINYCVLASPRRFLQVIAHVISISALVYIAYSVYQKRMHKK